METRIYIHIHTHSRIALKTYGNWTHVSLSPCVVMVSFAPFSLFRFWFLLSKSNVNEINHKISEMKSDNKNWFFQFLILHFLLSFSMEIYVAVMHNVWRVDGQCKKKTIAFVLIKRIIIQFLSFHLT